MHTSVQHKDPVHTRWQLFITDWLPRHNHKLNKDEAIPGMSISINAIKTCTNILKCITAEGIQLATLEEYKGMCKTMYHKAGHPKEQKFKKKCNQTGPSEMETVIIGGTTMTGREY